MRNLNKRQNKNMEWEYLLRGKANIGANCNGRKKGKGSKKGGGVD